MLQYPCTIRLRRAVGFLQGKPGWTRVSSSEIWPAPSPNTVRFHRSASLRIRSRDNVAGSASMAIACACSAASIISSRMARSRRIERLRFGQHMVTHPTMNGSTGDEVYSPPKNFGQPLRKILDFPPQTHTRFQRKQEINVAIRASIPTRHGAENFKARDPVAFTQFAQTFLVHDLDRHAQSLDAAQPIPASGSPSHRATPELRRRHPVAPRFAGLPDGSACLTGKRQRYSASKRPQDKRTLGRRRRTAASTW